MDNISTSAAKINKMYENLSYLDQYGGSVLFFILLLTILFIIVSYTQVMKNIQPIKDDWVNQRCKPQVIPFAGLINKPDNMTASDFTSQNFTNCMQNILTGITGFAVQPITYLTSSIQEAFTEIMEAVQYMRTILSSIRSSITGVIQDIMSRMANIMIPIQTILISFKDFSEKVKGILTAGLYTSLGSYYALTSFLKALMQFIITLLIILVALILAMWIIPFTMPLAATMTAVFVSISIPLAILLVFMKDTLHIDSGYSIPGVPSRPSCFDKNTLIKMNTGQYKKITEICVGDMLENNIIVTATLKLDSQCQIQKIYKLNETIVSEYHIVKFDDKWIHVSKHPKSILINNYKEPYLYCLNTNTKIINVNGDIYLDWDELFENDIINIKHKYINSKNINSDTYLNDIHSFFTFGFNENTKLKMVSNIKKIKDIDVGDLLENNNKIMGIVKLKNNLGNINLFHLITEKQYFYIYDEKNELNEKYHDYDYNIESFLYFNK